MDSHHALHARSLWHSSASSHYSSLGERNARGKGMARDAILFIRGSPHPIEKKVCPSVESSY
eukprot:scaffold4880_cov106-Cylindrotheca_fusiformis.AAC.14